MRQGFLYIISGAERYFREAGQSVTSLRRHSPGAHVTLVSDAVPISLPHVSSWFDSVVTQPDEPIAGRTLSPHVRGVTYRVRNIYRHSPYERTCHVDSDTYFLGDLQPLFALLDFYDMAMTLAPSDNTPVRVDGRELVGYTPYNCGLIVFRKSELTERFFERWHHWQVATLGDPQVNGNDQVTFMRTLLEVPCRVAVLQDNWNARTNGHERFRGPVQLIHGRHADPERVGRALNAAAAELRVWIPGVNVCLYDRMTLAQHVAYCVKTTRVLVRAVLRRLAQRVSGKAS
ncbi:MAG TPA: hypothetical protein VLV16_00185 [Gemmatimonadales bacterium]|nr:hypothetical protein [Gemmatimonadales bacterium]